MTPSCPNPTAFVSPLPGASSSRRWVALAFVVGFGVTAAASANAAPTDVCPALTGPAAAHDTNASWRSAHITQQSIGAEGFNLTVRGEPISAGGETTLRGIEVLDVATVQTEAGTTERVAHVRLAPALAETCGTNEIALRVDDAIGRNARIVSVRPEGLLTLVGDTLHFVRTARYGAAAPGIDVTYASSFELMPHVAHTAAKAAPKAKARKRTRRRSS